MSELNNPDHPLAWQHEFDMRLSENRDTPTPPPAVAVPTPAEREQMRADCGSQDLGNHPAVTALRADVGTLLVALERVERERDDLQTRYDALVKAAEPFVVIPNFYAQWLAITEGDLRRLRDAVRLLPPPEG